VSSTDFSTVARGISVLANVEMIDPCLSQMPESYVKVKPENYDVNLNETFRIVSSAEADVCDLSLYPDNIAPFVNIFCRFQTRFLERYRNHLEKHASNRIGLYIRVTSIPPSFYRQMGRLQ
jgi:hypothetical protein